MSLRDTLRMMRILSDQTTPLASWLARKIGATIIPHPDFQLVAKAQREFIDHLGQGVAIFGRDRRLLLSNKSFRERLGLPGSQAAAKPLFEDILDTARVNRTIPEQRDYGRWKSQKLELFDSSKNRSSEIWCLPNGRVQRISFVRNALGSMTIEIEDLTEKLELLTAYNALQRTQKATLDAFEDGIAIFGPDGRLKVHNRTLRRLVSLDEALLFSLPHVDKLSEAYTERFGPHEMWGIVIAAINSDAVDEPTQTVSLADGRAMVLALTRLPDGGTMLRLKDVSNKRRHHARR